MTYFFTYLAPLALLLPLADGDSATHKTDEPVKLDPRQVELISGSGKLPQPESISLPHQNQVRIEQRVIIRIAPQSASNRSSLVADLPQRAPSSKTVERKIGKCIPIAGIAGVQTGSGNNLLLYLRDRRVVTLRVKKSCRARDFYSGFYVESNKDGKLCVDRDELLSRSGAKCEVERMRQLVTTSK